MPDTDKAPFSSRHEAGGGRIGMMLRHWLPRSRLSQDQINAIASWGVGELGSLDSSKISQLRNERVQKISLRDLDALATLNQVIWRWQVEGPDAARARWGPPSSYGVQPEWLDGACWLANPDDKSQPLGFGQFCGYYAGYLSLPTFNLSPPAVSHGQRLSRALAELLDTEVAGQGLGGGMQRLLSCHPDPTNTQRVEKLQAVVLGRDAYSPSQLDAELATLAELVRQLRELPVGTYGPDQLRAELAARLTPVG